ncbi:MAG: hypothetical protein KDD61_18210, partial [Bdellovibrionales bacterium]|nr:hypothetical protein [Bdellovibrionales bacterium]
MSLLEKRLSEKILEECRGDLFLATESLHIQAFFKGHKKIDLQMGSEYSFYDLASLTKILFTVTA